MARVFRHTYTRKGRGGKRVTVQARKWYIEYRDSDGVRRRVPGYRDRTATGQYAAELVRAAERGETDLIDRYKQHRARPLSEHLDDFEQALVAKGTTAKHARQVTARARRLLDDCGFRHWPEISASKVQTFLADLQRDTEDKKGASPQTANFYLQAVKQFCRWLVRDGRAPENRLAHLQGFNVRTDRRHDRRALSADELRRLVTAAATGPIRHGMDGPARAMLYQLAVETGLRAGELRSLSRASFDLDTRPATVTVRAAYSKRRREDVLPLRAGLAERLRTFLAGRPADEPAFTMPRPDYVAKMMQTDLATAKIGYRDDAGRVADFHSLRHSFLTLLAAGGVHPKIAQALARHSTITLTMDRYSHTVLGDQAEALAALPDLSEKPDEQQRQKATGTDDAPTGDEQPDSLVPGLVFSLPSAVAHKAMPIAGYPTAARKTHRPAHVVSARKRGAYDSVSRAPVMDSERAGFEPAERGNTPFNGLANRRFQPLSHLSTTLPNRCVGCQRCRRCCADLLTTDASARWAVLIKPIKPPGRSSAKLPEWIAQAAACLTRWYVRLARLSRRCTARFLPWRGRAARPKRRV